MKDNWKDLLTEAEALAKRGTALVYKRLQKLKAVHDDSWFVKHCESIKTTPLAFMRRQVEDIGFSWQILMATLEVFPSESQWKGKPLQRVVAEAKLKRDAELAQSMPVAPKGIRRSEVAEQKVKELEADLSSKTKALQEQGQQLLEYRSARDSSLGVIADLEAELDRAKQRIRDLEQQLAIAESTIAELSQAESLVVG